MTQSYDKSPYTDRKIQKAKWKHKNATKNFDCTTIADHLRTVRSCFISRMIRFQRGKMYGCDNFLIKVSTINWVNLYVKSNWDPNCFSPNESKLNDYLNSTSYEYRNMLCMLTKRGAHFCAHCNGPICLVTSPAKTTNMLSRKKLSRKQIKL